MASSGTFSGKAVNSNVSCGVGGWADHSIRGSWVKGTNSTTFTAPLEEPIKNLASPTTCPPLPKTLNQT